MTELTIPEGTKPLFIPEDRKVFKYTYNVSPVEFYRMQLTFILPEVHPTKIAILAFIKVYGADYRKELLESTICSTLDSVRNYESTLRAENLISGYSPDIELNENIKFCEMDYVQLLYITKDEKIDGVLHKHYKAKANR